MTIKAIYELTTDAGQTVELSEQEYQLMKAVTEAPLRTANPPALYNTMTPSVPPGEHEPENPAP